MNHTIFFFFVVLSMSFLDTNAQSLPFAHSHRRIDSLIFDGPSSPNASTRDIEYRGQHRLDYQWSDNSWVDTGSHHYSFTNDCLIATDTTFRTNGTPAYLTKYEYDSTHYGRITKLLAFKWTLNSWDSVGSSRWTYYPQGLLKELVDTSYIFGWYQNYHILHTVDSTNSGYILNITLLNYNYSTGSFDSVIKTFFDFYPDSTVSGYSHYDWDGNSFQPAYKLSGMTYQSYQSQFDYKFRHFDYQIWDMQWVPDSRDTFIYSDYGSFQQVIEETDGINWHNYEQLTITYDSHFNWIDGLTQLWNNNQWITSAHSKHLLTYNFDGALTQDIWQTTNGIDTNLVNQYKYNFDDFTQCQSPVGIASSSSSTEISVFPNPVSNRITILTPTYNKWRVMICNLFGQQIISQSFSESTSIDVSTWLDGVYFVQILNERNEVVQTNKIIKVN